MFRCPFEECVFEKVWSDQIIMLLLLLSHFFVFTKILDVIIINNEVKLKYHHFENECNENSGLWSNK